MQQEDPFFYDHSKDKSVGKPWPKRSDNHLLQNPFEPLHHQDTLPHEASQTEKIIQELDDDEEKQLEAEEKTEIDSDREFDWDDDPDQIKPKRRRTTKERLAAAMQQPCCWSYLSPIVKRIIIAICGSCVFIVVAIVIYLTLPKATEEQLHDPNFTNVRSNVQCWMYWAAFMWHIYWVSTLLLDLVPSVISLWTKFFHGRRSEKVKSYMEYYMSLKNYFCLVVLAAWNLGSWIFLINHVFPSLQVHMYTLIITKVFGCILAAAGLFFIQKMVIQIIAVKFHRTAFSDRLKENKQCLKILDTLSKSEKKMRPTSGAAGGFSSNNLRKRRSPINGKKEQWGPQAVTLTDETAQAPSSLSAFKKFVLADTPTASTGGVDKSKMDINSNDYAKKVAKKLFYSLAYPEGYFGQEEDSKKTLGVYSFIPYFKDREQAVEAFKMFDKDGNGTLTRREFRDTIVFIYRERKSLAQSIRDTSQALGKIDILLLLVSTFITTCICLRIFNVEFWASLIPIGTFMAACTFMFGSSAESLFKGIMFQFVTHPYDSGDLIQIDGVYMTVKEIGILGTVFAGADGTEMYAPTSVLLTKIISNIRRSSNMGETLKFNIDFRTDNEAIVVLRERILEWVLSQPRDFGSGFDLRVTDIIDMNQVILTIWLPHKGNWADLGKRFQRKTRFMLALKSILTEMDIKYELPAQRITSSLDRNPFASASALPAQNFGEQETKRYNM
ncbi:Mechanosensitive ion channel-domain-containing protein [Blakeslea trispora]|nr:Mechanosensitive ion channel-domain-containing protein [Blakeslea trispora]